MKAIASAFCGALIASLYTTAILAQGAPPPLGPPPVPPGNPQTVAKINLGKALFWEEQLSITGTVACGSCHRPFSGGSDPRTALTPGGTFSPGPDGVFGNADDIGGSPGVPQHSLDGLYQKNSVFDLSAQVGTRKSPSAVNAAYAPLLFWDGRAGGAFSDPQTNQLLIPQGGALENQALGPLINTAEMAYSNAQVNDIGTRLASIKPLALATGIPATLSTWIAGRDYPALFSEVFGTSDLTAARIALAIASYERTLAATQTPFDAENGGTPSLTAQEIRGRGVFVNNDCAACHAGPLLSDNQFHYIGVRPVTDDLGRFVVTNNPPDRGAFRTPSLRNVGLRGPYFNNGRFQTLAEVVAFYNRGGDFTAPNKDPRVHPRNLNAQQQADLVAFLSRPLTDPRVAAETIPFDRPTLYTETTRAPKIVSTGTAGSGGQVPQIGALEPPLLGNHNFTVSVTKALGGAAATLVVSHSDPGVQSAIPAGDFVQMATTLNGVGAGAGYASMNIDLGNDPALIGQNLYGRFYVADAAAANGLAVTAAFTITVFGESDQVFRDGFE